MPGFLGFAGLGAHLLFEAQTLCFIILLLLIFDIGHVRQRLRVTRQVAECAGYSVCIARVRAMKLGGEKIEKGAKLVQVPELVMFVAYTRPFALT